MSRRILLAFALTLALASGGFVACGGDDDDGGEPTAGVTALATSGGSTPAASGTPSSDIRAINLEDVGDVKNLVEDKNGTFVQGTVIYADITGDGAEEAVVPVASDGTAGNAAFIVLMAQDGGTRTLLTGEPETNGGMSISVEDGKVVQREAVPGPDDPECCPSYLRETIYAWNGAALAIEDVRTLPNPGGGVKTPTN